MPLGTHTGVHMPLIDEVQGRPAGPFFLTMPIYLEQREKVQERSDQRKRYWLRDGSDSLGRYAGPLRQQRRQGRVRPSAMSRNVTQDV
jgi:hypothetical protein